MTLSWDVCRTRDGSGTISIADNKIDTKEERSLSVNYRAIANGITDPELVTEISAMRAPGVPRLKYNVYVDPDGTVFPYFSVRNKSATRNPSNPYVFDISVEYTDDSGSEGEDVQQTPQEYAANLKFDVKSRQRSSWGDVNGQPYMLPTGSKYKQPLMLDYPCLVLKQDQLESTNFGPATMKDRMLKVNSAAWTDGSGYTWATGTALITAISYETVSVPVGLGYITGYSDATKVIYTIEENDLQVEAGLGTDATKGLDPVNNNISTSVAVNWKQFRPRIDSIVQFGNPPRSVAASSINAELSAVYLQENGRYWHGPNNTNFNQVVPPIDTYAVYDSINFQTFLYA